MLFNIGNMTVWACCLSASFGWDERAVPAFLAIMMYASVIVLGDATCADFEYEIRSIFLIFTTLVCFSGTMVVGWGLSPLEKLAQADQSCIIATIQIEPK